MKRSDLLHRLVLGVQGEALVDVERGPGEKPSKGLSPGRLFASFWGFGQKDVAACHRIIPTCILIWLTNYALHSIYHYQWEMGSFSGNITAVNNRGPDERAPFTRAWGARQRTTCPSEGNKNGLKAKAL